WMHRGIVVSARASSRRERRRVSCRPGSTRWSPSRRDRLLGTFRAATRVVNFDGSAAMRPDGSVIAGIFVHSLADSTNNFTLEWTTDTTLAGTAKFDSTGDHQSDGTLDLRSVDCRSLSLP